MWFDFSDFIVEYLKGKYKLKGLYNGKLNKRMLKWVKWNYNLPWSKFSIEMHRNDT